jgi:hypothetical protein
MSAHFFNSYRSTKQFTDRNFSRSKDYPKIHNSSIAQCHLGKRGKLRQLIQEKMCKKYNLLSSNEVIENEINTFIQCDNLCDKDLKLLDNRIYTVLKEKGLLNNSTMKGNSVDKKCYSSVLNQQRQMENINKCNTESNIQKVTFKEEESQKNKCDKSDKNITKNAPTSRIMSGASQLSDKFKSGNLLRNNPFVPEEELIIPKKRTHRFEFEHEDDMWNAFNNENQRHFEQEKIDEKIKDKEIKRRTKEDLDNQIKQRLLRLDDERKKNSEYHGILIKHIDHLNLLEEQKLQRIKDKTLKEKENRDKQMWDQNYKKKVEKIKMRKFENQIIDTITGDIQHEKDFAVKKKIEQKIALQKTIGENEVNRIKKQKLKQDEVDDDIRCVEESKKILEKQENDRIQYFKNIELKSTDFMAQATGSVIKELKEKNKKADERMDEFLKRQDQMAIEAEKDIQMKKKLEKKDMKKFLDYQVEEKKKLAMFDKDIDEEQASIIKQDFHLYEDYKRNAAEKVRKININIFKITLHSY